MTGPLVSARGLHKSFARTPALRGASLDLAAGEVVAVTGPSGSGKSTLMLCLAGVLRPDGGHVVLDGRRLDELGDADRSRVRRRELGLVLQFGQLLPELSTVDNVALPLLLDGRPRREANGAARSWLARLGVEELTARPGELSGGEAQRVALARALVTGPRVVLADEPTGALDSAGAAAVLGTLLEVVAETGTTLLVVTHDNTVAAHADREVVLRDGRTEDGSAP